MTVQHLQQYSYQTDVVILCLLIIHADISTPPRNIRVVDVTTTSIAVTFDPIPCISQNANITDYAIDFGRSGNPPFVVGRIVEEFSFTLTGLDRNTSYFFEIYPIIDPSLGLNAVRVNRIVQTLSGNIF